MIHEENDVTEMPEEVASAKKTLRQGKNNLFGNQNRASES